MDIGEDRSMLHANTSRKCINPGGQGSCRAAPRKRTARLEPRPPMLTIIRDQTPVHLFFPMAGIKWAAMVHRSLTAILLVEK